MKRHRSYTSSWNMSWMMWKEEKIQELKWLLEALLLVAIIMFIVCAIFWAAGLPSVRYSDPLKSVQAHLSAFNKPLVKVEVFNQRPVDLLGRPTIFPDKENNNYAFLIRGMVGSTNFDEKAKDYLQKHPQDAVLVSPIAIGADAEKSILVFTDSPVPDPEYFRVDRK